MSKISRTAAAVAVVLMGGAAMPAQADGSVSVYVGYADNLRPSGFFPTTWIGDPNVVSETPAGESLDAGAIRIDNGSSSAITVSSFSVLITNAGTFSIWNPLTIAPGATGIFTQTGSYNFDTSDYGVFGGAPPAALAPNNFGGNGNSSLIGGCASSAAIVAAAGYTALCASQVPVVGFDIGSDHYSFNDSGQVLNTGGWDFVNNSAYGEDGNESINWNLIGTEAIRGGFIPEPSTPLLFAFGLAALAWVRRRATSR